MVSTVDAHRAVIGRARGELTTPALILDLEVLRRNIAAMAEWTKTHARIRPHTKVHKCAEIARLQVQAGAIGLTTATVWEASAMARAGFDNILIANEVGGEEKLSLLAAAARETNLIVAVDHPDGARRSRPRAASRIARSEFWSTSILGCAEAACEAMKMRIRVAQAVSSLPGLALRGAMGYEGWVVMEPDRRLRARKAAEAIGRLVARVERLETGRLSHRDCFGGRHQHA